MKADFKMINYFNNHFSQLTLQLIFDTIRARATRKVKGRIQPTKNVSAVDALVTFSLTTTCRHYCHLHFCCDLWHLNPFSCLCNRHDILIELSVILFFIVFGSSHSVVHVELIGPMCAK